MDYEKAYKEALERAKYLKENTDSVGALDISTCFEQIFPELKESEDEKIRSFLIGFIKVCRWAEKEDQGWPSKEECISWLEKKGEQKSWSEEDEKIIKKIIESLQRYMPTDELSEEQEMIAWLKFIEPNHLKQSEVKNETKNKCPNYSEGYGCSTSPLKQCDTCPDYKLYNHLTSLDRVTGHLKKEIEKERLNMEKCAEYKDYDTANICQQRIIAYEKAITIVNTLF